MSDVKDEQAVKAEPSIDTPAHAEVTKEEAVTEEVKAEPKDVEMNGTSETKEEAVKTEKSKSPEVKDEKDDRKEGRNNYKKPYKHENNSKYDPSVLPETSDGAAIRKQVEFYFSDSNLPTDPFLWEMTAGTTNLPVSVENLYKFGRMKRFKPMSAIVEALRSSPFLQVTGAEGQESVNRKEPYDPTSKSKIEGRSIYAKGFGEEEPSSQFDIESFFSLYGTTKCVRLRRSDDKLFKGSVFVEWEDEETSKKFLALEPKPLWKGKHELQVESKSSYMAKKNQEIREGKLEPTRSWYPRGRGRGRGGKDFHRGGRGGGDRGDRDPDDWKKRREDDRANGFKDRNGGRDNKGRGRGGRRGDDRPRYNDRNQDRNREREEKNGKEEGDIKKEPSTTEKAGQDSNGAETSTKEIKTEAPAAAENNEKKRAREDDGTSESPAPKKVDTKS